MAANLLLPGHWVTLHGLVATLGLATYVLMSHARRQRRHPSAAIAWVISIALLPYAALPLYLLLGSRKVLREQPSPVPGSLAVLRQPDTPAARFQHLAAAMGLPSASGSHDLAIHEDGQAALDALRTVLAAARQTLDVSTFLLGRDALGREVSERLMAQARAGVRVRLLVDGVGIYMGGRPDLKRLAEAGVQVALFVPPWRSALPGRTNLRNHRKLVVADGKHLWAGGRNLAAEYFVGDLAARTPKTPWTDLSFDLQGDTAHQAQYRFDQDWAFATQTAVPAASKVDGLAAAVPLAPDARGAQLIPSGPDQTDDTIYSLLISACFTAQRRILIVTPYFVPDATLLMALTLAARRGVAVDLLLPARSNHRLADMARHAALREMAMAGARVWLLPGMAHAKAIVIDDELALAGSANIDERSLFLNYELMVAFYATADVQRFAAWIERQREGASPYRSRPPGLARDFAEGLVRSLAFQL